MSMEISRASAAQGSTTNPNGTNVKKSNEIELFSNGKVKTDLNNIAARTGDASKIDAEDFTALADYFKEFKANLSASVQRYVTDILGKKVTYNVTNLDQATAARAETSAKEFSQNVDPGDVNIMQALGYLV